MNLTFLTDALECGTAHWVVHSSIGMLLFAFGWLSSSFRARRSVRRKFQGEADSFVRLMLELKTTTPDNASTKAILCQQLMQTFVPKLSRAYFAKDRPPASKELFEWPVNAQCRICEKPHTCDESGQCKSCGLPNAIWMNIAKAE